MAMQRKGTEEYGLSPILTFCTRESGPKHAGIRWLRASKSLLIHALTEASMFKCNILFQKNK